MPSFVETHWTSTQYGPQHSDAWETCVTPNESESITKLFQHSMSQQRSTCTCTVNSGMDGLTTGCTTWWSGSITACGPAGAAANVRWCVAAAVWCGVRLDDEDDVETPMYGVACWCRRRSATLNSSCNYQHTATHLPHSRELSSISTYKQDFWTEWQRFYN